MVHHQFHALAVGIVVEIFNVKIGIWSNEVKDIGLPHVGPVFPTDVPTLDEHLVEPVIGGKVDVTLHFLGIGTVTSVRLGFRVIGLSEFHAWKLIGVVPCAMPNNHFPPHATVLCWVNPAGVVNLARLVKVENEA